MIEPYAFSINALKGRIYVDNEVCKLPALLYERPDQEMFDTCCSHCIFGFHVDKKECWDFSYVMEKLLK